MSGCALFDARGCVSAGRGVSGWLCAAAACAAVLATRPAAAEIIDRVLAVVDGVVITESDVAAMSSFGLAAVESGDPAASALSQAIDRQLILAEVERYAPPDPSPEAVAARVQQIRRRFPSAAAFEAALRRVGLDDARLEQLARDQLRIESYLGQRFAGAERSQLIAEWVAGLRRRADISYLNVPRR